jgi:hypothetical protein
MNGTEAKYAQWLDHDSTVYRWWFNPFGMRLARATHYHPDFLIQRTDGLLELHEVKGFWRDDARVKVKIAAEMYPFPISIVTYSKKEGFHVEPV